MTNQAILDCNKDKWNRVFIHYEQYKLALIGIKQEILSFREWLVQKYKPVKLYFPHIEGTKNPYDDKQRGGNRWTKD